MSNLNKFKKNILNVCRTFESKIKEIHVHRTVMRKKTFVHFEFRTVANFPPSKLLNYSSSDFNERYYNSQQGNRGFNNLLLTNEITGRVDRLINNVLDNIEKIKLRIKTVDHRKDEFMSKQIEFGLGLGFIYVEKTNCGEVYKIGYSTNMKNRQSVLNSNSDRIWDAVYVSEEPVPDPTKLEKKLKVLFEDKRINGKSEFLNLTKKDLTIISEEVEGWMDLYFSEV